MTTPTAEVVSKYRFGNDYKTHFDTKTYLNRFNTLHNNPHLYRILQKLHQLEDARPAPKGGRLLDVGSGPCINTFISAGRESSEIVCAEFLERNQNEISKWVNGDPDAHDWSPHFKYVCQLEGRSDEWEKRQAHIRKAIKQVIPCDVRQENPLAPLTFEPFDVITSGLCLEVACRDEPSYRNVIKNVASLLKPGGFIFLLGIHDESFYRVGNELFNTFPTNKATIEGAFTDAGFTDFLWDNNDNFDQETSDKNEVDYVKKPEDYNGLYTFSALKRSN